MIFQLPLTFIFVIFSPSRVVGQANGRQPGGGGGIGGSARGRDDGGPDASGVAVAVPGGVGVCGGGAGC